jgi:hypothetical protein
VPEHDRLTGAQLRRDLFLPQPRLRRVRGEDDDDVGPGGGVAHFVDGELLRLGLAAALGSGVQGDAHFDARVTKIEGVSVPLRAVADDGDLFLADQVEVGVRVVEDIGHCASSKVMSRTEMTLSSLCR